MAITSMWKLFLSLIFLVSVSEAVHVLDTNGMEVKMRSTCTGKMGLCFWAEEMEMDSESNRRVMQEQKKYISYETLRREVVPCSTPGASYYNCHVMGHANNYGRGCEQITRCDRNIKD